MQTDAATDSGREWALGVWLCLYEHTIYPYAAANMFRFNSSQVAQMGETKIRLFREKKKRKQNWNEIHGAHLISCAPKQGSPKKSKRDSWSDRTREREKEST